MKIDSSGGTLGHTFTRAPAQEEIDQAWGELRGGGFYRQRARYDYRLAADDSDVPYTTPAVTL